MCVKSFFLKLKRNSIKEGNELIDSKMGFKQTSVFINYLKMKTNYAVILFGDYGIGKTYYYKNILSKKIEQTSILEDESIKYRSIHISLFGVKNIEDIKLAILGELYPILKSNNLKLGSSIAKTLLRGVFKIGQLGDIDKYIEDFKSIDIQELAKDKLTYKQLVICFDDIDRKNKEFDLGELFGFINSLVENEGAKIILIANEDVLKKDSGDEYHEVLEKVVGVRIQFISDIEAVCRTIIEENYKNKDLVYCNFLISKFDTILSFIKTNKNNLRSLLFCLEHFKSMFSSIELLFQNKNKYIIARDEVLNAVFEFSMAIMIETKHGRLGSENANLFLPSNTVSNNIKNSVKNTSSSSSAFVVDTYSEEFRKKYFINKRFYRFASCVEYVLGMKQFDINTFEQEIILHFSTLIEVDKKEYKVYKKLQYYGCLDLSDDEYKEFTDEMLGYVDQGVYKLLDYPILFEYTLRFDNLLGYDIEDLKNRFKKGIERGKPFYESVNDYLWEVNIRSPDSEFPVHLEEVLQFCKDVNQEVYRERFIGKKLVLFELFKNDFDGFYELVTNSEIKWRGESYLDQFDVEETFKVFIEMENSKIWEFAKYLSKRYPVNLSGSQFENEMPFLEGLSELLVADLKTRKGLKSVAFKKINEALQNKLKISSV